MKTTAETWSRTWSAKKGISECRGTERGRAYVGLSVGGRSRASGDGDRNCDSSTASLLRNKVSLGCFCIRGGRRTGSSGERELVGCADEVPLLLVDDCRQMDMVSLIVRLECGGRTEELEGGVSGPPLLVELVCERGKIS